MPVIAALSRVMEDGFHIVACLGYILKPCLKKPKYILRENITQHLNLTEC
jgi:hypothetical protein